MQQTEAERFDRLRALAETLFANALIDTKRVARLALQVEAIGTSSGEAFLRTLREVYGPAIAANLDPVIMAQERLAIADMEASRCRSS